MTKHLWKQTTKTLGKLLAAMVSLPESQRRTAAKGTWRDYPRFPAF